MVHSYDACSILISVPYIYSDIPVKKVTFESCFVMFATQSDYSSHEGDRDRGSAEEAGEGTERET